MAVTKGKGGGDLGPPAAGRDRSSRKAAMSRLPDAYLDERTAAFVSMSQGKGKPMVWGGGKKDK